MAVDRQAVTFLFRSSSSFQTKDLANQPGLIGEVAHYDNDGARADPSCLELAEWHFLVGINDNNGNRHPRSKWQHFAFDLFDAGWQRVNNERYILQTRKKTLNSISIRFFALLELLTHGNRTQSKRKSQYLNESASRNRQKFYS